MGMQITSYQMHNVLNCYSRQLSQNRRSAKSSAVNRQGENDTLRSESGGKREATLEAVSNDIYNKLTDLTSLDTTSQENATVQQKLPDPEQSQERSNQQPTEFKFNVIDRLNRKITNQLSVEDSSGFIKRLEKLEKEAVEKKIESWI